MEAPSRRTRFGVNQMDLEQIAITKRRKHNQQLFPFTTSMNKNLKNVVYALFAGCFGGLLLPLVMKIPSESSAANVLKWVASVLAIP
jgi:hypothetical protein